MTKSNYRTFLKKVFVFFISLEKYIFVVKKKNLQNKRHNT
jgi:hypothetical protein